LFVYCTYITHFTDIAPTVYSERCSGWGKGGNVTPAGWQVTLCDPIWHVSSGSGAVLVAQTAIRFFTFVLAALRGSLGLVVPLSCVTDVSVSHVLLVERFVLAVLK